MIKFRLFCKKCSKDFDSWFASSKEYEKLKKSKLLNCPKCNSYNIKKSLMAPSIINNKKKINNLNSKKHTEIKNKLKKYKKFVENNFDMLEIILHTKLDQFIIIIKKEKKEFMVTQLRKKLKSFQMKVLILKLYLG